MGTTAKKKRYTIVLSEAELRRLTAYAAAAHASRPVALMRLLRRALRDAADTQRNIDNDPKQLRLFDAMQINIFGQCERCNDAENID